MFKVTFEYDEIVGKWEVIVEGAKTPLEAIQGFNSVLITCSQTQPSMQHKPMPTEDGKYKMNVLI